MKNEARLDVSRFDRIGMIEAIWGEHKSCEQIIGILATLESKNLISFVTRIDSEKARILMQNFPRSKYHKQAKCLVLGENIKIYSSLGQVFIISGGTSDAAVVAETELSLNIHGVKTKVFQDVGVAGLHRLLDNLKEFESARVLIACAGMEGALPTVLSGLVPQPVIGIPVSVGYGVSLSGQAALSGMLSSCSPGLTVVNIDNGYGAAMAALRILRS
tara:strand:+ start:4310 stop:4960 length:651 start_codon:yes stop_codon:yes gene_type:complete